MRKQLVYGILLASMALSLTACDGSNYKKATELYNNGQYAEAAEIFTKLGDYEDSADMVLACQYGEAKALYEAGDYEGALEKFEGIREYEDSAEYIAKANMRSWSRPIPMSLSSWKKMTGTITAVRIIN